MESNEQNKQNTDRPTDTEARLTAVAGWGVGDNGERIKQKTPKQLRHTDGSVATPRRKGVKGTYMAGEGD